jgi:hypothetical protein
MPEGLPTMPMSQVLLAMTYAPRLPSARDRRDTAQGACTEHVRG